MKKQKPNKYRKRGKRKRTRPGRAIHPADAKRIIRGLNTWASTGNFTGLRTRAIVYLAWGSALRISECLALDVSQIRDTSTKRLRIRERPFLRHAQAKNGNGGRFLISPRAQTALRAYLLEARRRDWIDESWTGPLFIGAKRWRKGGHDRLAYRSFNILWNDFLNRLELPERYRFHDIRHDSITRYSQEVNGDVSKVMRFGRLKNMKTASVYVHEDMTKVLDAAKRAAI